MKKKIVATLTTLALILPAAILAQVPQIPSFTLSSSNVKQGDVLVVTLSPYAYGFRTPKAVVRVFDRIFEPNNRGAVYIGIDPETKPGKYKVCLVEGYVYWYCTEVNIFDRKFQEVRVGRKKMVRDIPNRTDEIAATNRAYQRGDLYQSYADGLYIEPLDTIFKTQEFYRKVFFRNGMSVHNGVDLRTSIGTPIKAINSGKIVLTAWRFSLEGNMVVLDHGSGIFSLYLHLSRIDVREGQMIKKGDMVGLSGDIGLDVTGPHLHFAVKVNKVNVDPLEFIKTMNAQK